MPYRQMIVPSERRSDESRVFKDFANLSLADERIPGRTYGPGTHYASSAPKHETRSSGRTYARDPPPSYHGRRFEKATAQEQLWNARGGNEVWDPSKPLRSVAARPETHGRAHSFHQPIQEHKYSDPYVKRPHPYPPRVVADYKAYKDPSEGQRPFKKGAAKAKNVNTGRKAAPDDSARDALLEGMRHAKTGRDMANVAWSSRVGFHQKYPQSYQSRAAIDDHHEQIGNQRGSAMRFREDGDVIKGKLNEWKDRRAARDKEEREKQRGRR
ncbi:hypothetical protein N8T08_008446 [Aspergillus melleus]|uniref:Uncharacterized protein n=1 Tax=Aspergillus melleus TaxID=138277 RepID=A0ACC3AV88_9EURO|nr:hypothetical protein N8T08_008446 [Aspergillus melleus]